MERGGKNIGTMVPKIKRFTVVKRNTGKEVQEFVTEERRDEDRTHTAVCGHF